MLYKIVDGNEELLSDSEEELYRAKVQSGDALTKIINNKEFIVPPEEETLIREEWAANAPDWVKIRIGQCKQVAGAKILAIAPEWRQRNMIAKATELQNILLEGGTLTTKQEALRDKLKAVWDSVKAVRRASNKIEAEIKDSADPKEYVVDPNPLWP